MPKPKQRAVLRREFLNRLATEKSDLSGGKNKFELVGCQNRNRQTGGQNQVFN